MAVTLGGHKHQKYAGPGWSSGSAVILRRWPAATDIKWGMYRSVIDLLLLVPGTVPVATIPGQVLQHLVPGTVPTNTKT